MTVMWLMVTLVSCLLCPSVSEVTNLLANPSFEAPLRGSWRDNGFQMTQFADDKVHGRYSLRCTNRDSDLDGPSQDVGGLQSGRGYEFRADVKLLNDIPGKVWQNFKVVLKFSFAVKLNGTTVIARSSAGTPTNNSKPDCKDLKKDDRKQCRAALKEWKREQKEKKKNKRKGQKEKKRNGQKNRQKKGQNEKKGDHLPEQSYIIAYNGFVTAEQGWHVLAGSINAPVVPFGDVRVQIRGPDAGANFLIDNVTLYEVPNNDNWLTDSHRMIDTHRKSDVTLRFKVPPTVDPGEIVVQIKHTRHEFAFGSKVEDDLVNGRGRQEQAYRNLFFNLFNWATMGSYKWRFDKSADLYHPDFSNAVRAVEVLRQNKIKVRAHSIFWGIEENIPDAVINTPKEQLPALIRFHTEYMMNITKGKVEQWDIQNEYIYGHWYEVRLQDPLVTVNIFKHACPMDPQVKCYLNDFQAVNAGGSTEDYINLAKRFLKAGTGLEGLGIQGHVKDFVRPDPTMIKRRLDRLSTVGLELFITEFDIGWDDDVERADWFEDAMRAYFAHPGLSGVVLWGFWRERQRYKNEYLVYGNDLKFAEQGERFVCLTQKEWTTNEKRNLSSGTTVSLRGFRGDYDVIIKRNGVPVQRETFSLGTAPSTLNIDVVNSRNPVSVPEKFDYVPQCISHRDRKSLGTAASSSNNLALTCRTKQASGTADVSVTCDAGEVMTECSSRGQNEGTHSWRGERIVVNSRQGVPSCVGMTGVAGGTVSARCCSQRGLECDYRQAGPSQPFDGALAQAVCPQGYFALGCSAHSQHSKLMTSYAEDALTSCFARSGPPVSDDPETRSGALSTAACCKSPSMRCETRRSVFSHPSAAQSLVVSCLGPSDVITDCSVVTDSDGSAQSRITTDGKGNSVCQIFATGGTVTATATCCH